MFKNKKEFIKYFLSGGVHKDFLKSIKILNRSPVVFTAQKKKKLKEFIKEIKCLKIKR